MRRIENILSAIKSRMELHRISLDLSLAERLVIEARRGGDTDVEQGR